MKTRLLLSPRLLLFPLAIGCEDLDLGRSPEDEGPPKLVRLLVQDEDRRGGRFQVTDLLNTAADLACSLTQPCPSFLIDPETGGPVECAIPEEASEGTCPDATKPSNTPPQVGTPIALGGIQIRLVFSKGLSPELDAALADEATRFLSLETAGGPVESVAYLDPGGSPSVTSDSVREPYGPALVLKPTHPPAPATAYTVKLDPAKIVDRSGQAATEDLAGPIKSSYEFTTEAFHARSLTPDFSAGVEIKTNEGFQLELNADVDPEGGEVIVTRTSTAVPVRWFPDCDGGPRYVDLVPLDENGEVTKWAPGEYEVTFKLVAIDGGAEVKADPFGDSALSGTFTVAEDEGSLELLTPIDGFTLPEDCE
ncbi:MAG: hypothetical protein HYV07_10535 [Deltaproteobacteria bacterium]|nr:hypothetical protein [Deltaproteobacteria bacterium]